MPFFSAGHSEVIYGSQKDEQYRSHFRNSLGGFFRDLTGTQSWIRRKEELELFADIVYFGLTTLSGYQTLGEEYCSLIQVDKTRQNIPTTWQRGSMVLSHVVVPYLCKKFLRRLEQTLQLESFHSHSQVKNIILILMPLLKHLITILHRMHLVSFYFSSVYYDISKRITGIQYLLAQGVLKTEAYNNTYKVLGWVALLHLLVSVGQFIQQLLQDLPKLKTAILNTELDTSSSCQGQASISSKYKCTLCLEKLHDITATPCGHLFCWYCIHEWCRNKAECPLCREDIQLPQLVYLHHFEPT